MNDISKNTKKNNIYSFFLVLVDNYTIHSGKKIKVEIQLINLNIIWNKRSSQCVFSIKFFFTKKKKNNDTNRQRAGGWSLVIGNAKKKNTKKKKLK